jgi:hypothetical protein
MEEIKEKILLKINYKKYIKLKYIYCRFIDSLEYPDEVKIKKNKKDKYKI